MKKRLLFLGPPGAGKGTQAEKICQINGLMHLSTGDLLRAEVAAKSVLGNEAARVMSQGELVSDELVLSIVETRLSSQEGGWILDGFPRTVIQAQALKTLLVRLDQPIEAVVLLKLDDEILVKRLLARGRSDDNEQVIRHRLEVYLDKTAPLIDYYSQQGLLSGVNATGSIEVITKRIENLLK